MTVLTFRDGVRIRIFVGYNWGWTVGGGEAEREDDEKRSYPNEHWAQRQLRCIGLIATLSSWILGPSLERVHRYMYIYHYNTYLQYIPRIYPSIFFFHFSISFSLPPFVPRHIILYFFSRALNSVMTVLRTKRCRTHRPERRIQKGRKRNGVKSSRMNGDIRGSDPATGTLTYS